MPKKIHAIYGKHALFCIALPLRYFIYLVFCFILCILFFLCILCILWLILLLYREAIRKPDPATALIVHDFQIVGSG